MHSLTIRLDPRLERSLRARAAECGVELEELVGEALRALARAAWEFPEGAVE